MGIIVFNNISSQDYHIQVEHPPGYEIPERDFDVIHIPGKSGDVFIDKGSYKNVNRTYQIAVSAIEEDFTTRANCISEWLHSASGYARLEDSYEPEYYRMAAYKNSLTIENLLNQAGRATIAFNCKPQRFLKSGERVIYFSKNGKIRNPTRFESTPIINVKGNGRGILRIGNYIITISEIDSALTINSEIQDAYSGTINRNPVVTLNNGFPKLTPGDNEISYSGGITSVEVLPKWWTL